jgi:hypothetical protein
MTTRLGANVHTEMSFIFCGKMACVAQKYVLHALIGTLTESVMVALTMTPPQTMQRWLRQAKAIRTRPIHFNRC